MRRALLAALLAASCTGPLARPSPTRVADYRGSEIRRPAVTVRLAFGPGDFGEHERATLPEAYAGALIDALDAAAVLPVDVSVGAALDRAAALARAQEVRADHAVIVDAKVARGLRTYCRDATRSFTVGVTSWTARLDVVRTTDSATRLIEPELEVADFEEDCDDPRSSQRFTIEQTIAASVRKVVTSLLRP
jgi:hypothetical protein